MRRIFKRRIYRLGEWLARKAERLQGVADDLRDWAWDPGPARNDDLSRIINATLANRSGAIADHITRHNALLKRLANG